MGFIHENLVEVHEAKNGNICLKYPFINKNGEQDTMYIALPKGTKITRGCGYVEFLCYLPKDFHDDSKIVNDKIKISEEKNDAYSR